MTWSADPSGQSSSSKWSVKAELISQEDRLPRMAQVLVPNHDLKVHQEASAADAFPVQGEVRLVGEAVPSLSCRRGSVIDSIVPFKLLGRSGQSR